jgi:hypothetical protein
MEKRIKDITSADILDMKCPLIKQGQWINLFYLTLSDISAGILISEMTRQDHFWPCPEDSNSISMFTARKELQGILLVVI